MLPIDSVIERLSFIRYLYNLGVEQTRLPKPMHSISILAFHDSAELFLGLVTEYVDLDTMKARNKKDPQFMEYWDLLETQKTIILTEKKPMERVNRVRVNFKHHGIRPSESAIDECRVSTGAFLKDNTQLVFSLEFDSVSMSDLINNSQIKTEIKAAEKLMQTGKSSEDDRKSAAERFALAYEFLIGSFKRTMGKDYFDAQRLLGGSVTVGSYTFTNLENLQKAVKGLYDTNMVHIIGLNYPQLYRFKSIVPYVALGGSNNYHFHHQIKRLSDGTSQEIIPTSDELEFCFNFMLESAIKAQEAEANYIR